MNLTPKLDSLLKSLDNAHKIILNEKNITIVKLYDNAKFYEWLKMNSSLPQLKSYHNSSNFKSSQSPNNPMPSDSIFITMAIIPNIKQQINIACCSTDIDKMANKMFSASESSGLIFNGSYFYLDIHIRDKIYGIDVKKNIYGDYVWSETESIASYLEKPIGFFNYDSTKLGSHADANYKNKTYKNIYDGKSLEKGYDVQKKTASGEILYDNNTQFTLQIISDALGIVSFPKDGGIDIKKYTDVVEYNETNSHPKINDSIKDNNMVMGNLLVYNDQIILTEEKMAIAIVLFNIDDIGIKMYDKIYLCDDTYTKLTGNQINKLSIGSSVFFTSYNDPTKKGSIIFNSKNLYLPYSIEFIKKEYPKNFAGKIPPGYLNHSSDLNPRTCIMNDTNGNIIVMHIEGRQKVCGGIGIDLFDLAKLCSTLGAQHAVNLDGGGSSKMTWKEKYNPINSVGVAGYKISNAIFVQ